MDNKQTESPLESLSYEQAVAKIEALLSELEQSDIPLEQAIKQFEEGTKLIKHCEHILADTEQKIVGLTSQASNQIANQTGQVSQQSQSSQPQTAKKNQPSQSTFDDDIPF